MSTPFIGEIIAVSYYFGDGFSNGETFLPCNGQILPIQQYSALFALIGTTYGGNGQTNFGLPNLNGDGSSIPGRIAMSQGQGPGLSNYDIGEQVGSMSETLTLNELPSHSHGMQLGSSTATGATPNPGTATAALNPNFNGFLPDSHINTTLAANSVGLDGGGLAHANNQPTTEQWYCIAVTGIFPSFG